MAAEKSGTSTPSKGQAWFCTTGLPSDIIVEVDNMTFHLHKVTNCSFILSTRFSIRFLFIFNLLILLCFSFH